MAIRKKRLVVEGSLAAGSGLVRCHAAYVSQKGQTLAAGRRFCRLVSAASVRGVIETTWMADVN